MRYRAFASVLTFAIVAPFAAAGIARAEPLTIGACEELKAELTRLDSIDVTRALDEGPEWATKNLSGEQLERAKRYVHVDEIVRFRCPEREDLTNGKPPPLPEPAPHRVQKIKETEVLAKVETAKQAEAERQMEALKAAEAERAAQGAARQAEAEKRKAEAEAARAAQEPGSPPFAAADESGRQGGRAASADKAAASLAPGGKQPGGGEPLLKTRLKGDPVGLSLQAQPNRRAPLSADGIVPGEPQDPAKRRQAGNQRASRAEPVQAVPVDVQQLKAAQSEAEQRSLERAKADEDSWFSFFRRSFR